MASDDLVAGQTLKENGLICFFWEWLRVEHLVDDTKFGRFLE